MLSYQYRNPRHRPHADKQIDRTSRRKTHSVPRSKLRHLLAYPSCRRVMMTPVALYGSSYTSNRDSPVLITFLSFRGHAAKLYRPTAAISGRSRLHRTKSIFRRARQSTATADEASDDEVPRQTDRRTPRELRAAIIQTASYTATSGGCVEYDESNRTSRRRQMACDRTSRSRRLGQVL